MADYLEKQFKSLRPLNNFASLNLSEAQEGYKIVPLATPQWKTAKRRILFVIESMDRIDLRNGKLFSSELKSRGRSSTELNLMIDTIRNTLQQSWLLYQEVLGRNSMKELPAAPNFEIGFVNFNARKYFHLKGTQRSNALLACAKRAISITEAMQPTDVVILGDTASRYMIREQGRDRDTLPWRRGWVIRGAIGQHKCFITPTLDIEPLYNSAGVSDDSDESGDDDASGPADLLYYVCRHLTHAYGRKIPYQVDTTLGLIRVIDTIEKFDAFYAKLIALPKHYPTGFDIETATLEAYNNTIYTMQIALSRKGAYLLVLRHPNTPFTEEQLVYIEGKMRAWLAIDDEEKTVELVGTNIQFDMKVCRGVLRIPVIFHRVWDVPAAETLLDENIALFNRLSFRYGAEKPIKTTQGNLRAIYCSYGNDAYFTLPFSKEQRATIGHVNILTHKDAQQYCCEDAVSVLRIRRAQIRRAKLIRISKLRTYRDYFIRHVANQMSNTCHSTSHMHQDGSHVDVPYMKYLASKSSPLRKVQKEVEGNLRTMSTVDEANDRLLSTTGMAKKGLFNKVKINLFSITKGEGLHHLFFGVLGLKPLSISKKTGKPSVDKAFLKEYGPIHPEAAYVSDWRVASKLMSTYVIGWMEKVFAGLDSKIDHCLRASFGFFIVTGRLNSFDPNLQQAPSRGPSAKYIKEGFRARKGRMNFSWDFNAAEVRKAAVLSGDKELVDAFATGLRLRRELIKCSDPEKRKEIMKLIKTKGDVHVASVFKFFGQWVDKDHPLRQAIKQVVFGVLFGKSPKSLSNDMIGEARMRHRDNIIDLRKKITLVKKKIAELS